MNNKNNERNDIYNSRNDRDKYNDNRDIDIRKYTHVNNRDSSNNSSKFKDNKGFKKNHYNPYSKNNNSNNNYNESNQQNQNEQCKMYNLPTIITSQKESDPVKLKSRQKDIDFGKNTIGYDNYVNQVPKDKREQQHPRTPDKFQRCSRRSWVGQVKKWRRQLHKFDPNAPLDDNDDDNQTDERDIDENEIQNNNNNIPEQQTTEQTNDTDDQESIEANQLLLSSLLSSTVNNENPIS